MLIYFYKNTYLNSNENAKKPHEDILSQNSCDVSVLIVINVEKRVTKHDWRLILCVLQVLSSISVSKERRNPLEESFWFSEMQVYSHIIV